jgi:hypothetical protein
LYPHPGGAPHSKLTHCPCILIFVMLVHCCMFILLVLLIPS